MPARIIKGSEISDQIKQEIKVETQRLKQDCGITPGLVTILVGNNPASVSYVTAKQKTAHELGFYSVQENLPQDISEKGLIDLIDRYNLDQRIHGILVQLPLPKHIDEHKIINTISPDKDVDCFHPLNLGKLLIGGDDVVFKPCTPAGIQELMIRSDINISGAEVVVVGRSNIVGKPLAVMLMQKGKNANATVTVVHTATKDLSSHCKRADILIVAAGVPNLVKPDWVKPGACVIDVGVNRVGERISEKTGKPVPILKGDVDFDAVKDIAGAITPVPGGVGPMTITMLMKNTLLSALMHAKRNP
ncbi:MAG: bifunctional methylenetetrahydrofolate dehydrogenase/methenyltetrahydrofolate cyclohydrolase [Thermodesulfovibrionales bacterium]|nr:bifunctional methylenetetrahydrofolate dehydrogenase/methenyltetrahydrofolate cyclohydrolase [Thermodesulfovibrionales bacterium]